MPNSEPKITAIRPAGPDHQVITVEGNTSSSYRREPCADCPWCEDSTGIFPAEAFRHSACTAFDMSSHIFSCHQSGAKKPAICAGFLLKGAAHNLSVRLKLHKGELIEDVSDGGRKLHESYRAMAIANGVSEDDPALARCRDA